jgi:hypothetical protein
MQVQWAKDFFRAVDYLETRKKDIDMQKFGYYSLSTGVAGHGRVQLRGSAFTTIGSCAR